MKNLLAMILMGCLLLSSSCNKDDEPDCVDCPEREFVCKINGEEWRPDCESGTILWGCTAVDCQYYNDTRALDIRVVKEKTSQRIFISARGLLLGDNPIYSSGRDFLDYTKSSDCIRYDMDSTLSNRITVLSLDTVHYTIEGTFEFIAKNKCGNTIEVTDGYFLLGYRF